MKRLLIISTCILLSLHITGCTVRATDMQTEPTYVSHPGQLWGPAWGPSWHGGLWQRPIMGQDRIWMSY